MYLQITTKCNMRCGHCLYSCEPGKGEDMSLETFRAALVYCDEYPCIGGGEPTMHPEFGTILLETMAHADSTAMIITNGKIKKWGLLLAKLSKSNILQAELSQDEYHEEVDPEVVTAFEALGDRGFGFGGHAAIRNTTRMHEPWPMGRAKETYFEGYDESDLPDHNCPCPDHVIRPNGDVAQCGCPDSPVIGNVFDGFEPMEDKNGDISACHKDCELQPA